MPRTCANCGGPLRSHATTNYCSRTATCRSLRDKARRASEWGDKRREQERGWYAAMQGDKRERYMEPRRRRARRVRAMATPEDRARRNELERAALARSPERRARATIRTREWRKANPDKAAAIKRRSYVTHQASNVEYAHQYVAAIRAQVFGHYGRECAHCGRQDGLALWPCSGSVAFYKALIASGFPRGYYPLCPRCLTHKRFGTLGRPSPGPGERLDMDRCGVHLSSTGIGLSFLDHDPTEECIRGVVVAVRTLGAIRSASRRRGTPLDYNTRRRLEARRTANATGYLSFRGTRDRPGRPS